MAGARKDPPPLASGELCLGIDLGTNGARMIAVDGEGRAVARAVQPMPPPERQGVRAEQDPQIWWQAVLRAFALLAGEIDLSRIRRMAVDGTSGTFLLLDEAGNPRGAGIMYNDARGGAAAAQIAAVAPGDSGAHGATSALARLMAVREADEDARAETLDLFADSYGAFNTLAKKTYLGMVAYAPKL